ncbi:endolytic transglycosylase MltG [Melioribacteraceae bacterium 4301-Me]|uniref:endolytic transglycosylase MltG n=1 Tax=Pyranulibacter aquaticus TaxID=3163344 RepID=UPI0035971E75
MKFYFSNSKSLLSNNDIYLVSIFFGFVLGLLLFTFFSPNYYNEKEPVSVDIPKGLTLSQVVDSLYKKNVIPNKTNMKIAAVLYGAERKIKAGRYQIPNGLSYLQLIELLLKGEPEKEIRITIPEGIWQNNLAKLLKDSLGIDSTEFMRLSNDKNFLNQIGVHSEKLEGYLLPDTYYFFRNSTAVDVILRLKNAMYRIFTDTIKERMKELNMTMNQVLTLASIIDAESNKVSEFRRISGVYHNRLKKGMLLQADPTIQYLIRDKHKNKIYYKNLLIDSKYNTYLYNGLPPSPINNPGKDAIYAALYPEKHNYYYFVADGNGGHLFAKNEKEHLINVRKYREWRKLQTSK